MKLHLLPKIELINDDTDSGRFYYQPEFPSIRYPSVTSVLGKTSELNHTWLDKWIVRVGKEKANEISSLAARRGSNFHNICEKYVLGEDHTQDAWMLNLMLFEESKYAFKPITKIYGVEYAMFNKEYNTAGRTDLLAEWNGYLPVVIDFKTSKYEKKKEDILSYFLQVTMYAIMASQQTGMNFEHGIIMIFCDNAPVKLFKFQIAKYIPLVNKIFIATRGA